MNKEQLFNAAGFSQIQLSDLEKIELKEEIMNLFRNREEIKKHVLTLMVYGPMVAINDALMQLVGEGKLSINNGIVRRV